jgi:hypothetical protein
MTPRWLVCVLLCFCAACTLPPPPVSGLRPAYPAPWGPKVDSLVPTLRWESFPRPTDLGVDAEGWVARIQGVTYDLRIWRTVRGDFPSIYPGDLVYSRDGVPEPLHTVETPLAPDTSYLWSIRARFDLDGEMRVTEWSMLKFPNEGISGPRAPRVPPLAYYRFKTP